MLKPPNANNILLFQLVNTSQVQVFPWVRTFRKCNNYKAIVCMVTKSSKTVKTGFSAKLFQKGSVHIKDCRVKMTQNVFGLKYRKDTEPFIPCFHAFTSNTSFQNVTYN